MSILIDKVMKIKEIWFTNDYIYGRNETGREYSQSLLWYPNYQDIF